MRILSSSSALFRFCGFARSWTVGVNVVTYRVALCVWPFLAQCRRGDPCRSRCRRFIAYC